MDDCTAPFDPLGDGHPLRSETRAVLAGWTVGRTAAMKADPAGYDKQVCHALLQSVWRKVASADDVRVVAEEIGAACCPVPLHSGWVQPAALLASLGEPAGPRLAQLQSGQRRYALGLHDEAGMPIVSAPSVVADPAAEGGWRLSGRLRHLLFADDADVLLVPARARRGGAAIIAAVSPGTRGVSLTTHRAMDGAGLSDLELDDATVPADDALGLEGAASAGGPALAMAFASGIVARCAELTGLAAGLLQLTVERVSDRRAFGQPLGALPTVQQRAADMYLDVTAARDATVEAAARLAATDGSPRSWGELDVTLRLSVSGAHVTATQAALRVAAGAHQLCGGWGQLADAGLHHYTRAIKTAESQLGSVRYHRALIAGALAGG